MDESGYYEYAKGHLILLDSDVSSLTYRDDSLIDTHQQKNKMVARVFEKHFEYQIHELSFALGARAKSVRTCLSKELEKIPENELAVIYFHGGAGEQGTDYSWRFQKSPKREIDAYKVIQAVIDSEVDCLIILDCYLPGRFRQKWKASGSNVELIASGQPLQHADGTLAANDSGDFTKSLVVMLNDLMLNRDKWYPNKETVSLPELLKRRTNMSDNPRRLWINKPADAENQSKERLVMIPAKIRATGKIKFNAVACKGANGAVSGEKMKIVKLPITQQMMAHLAAAKPSETEDSESEDDFDEDEGVDVRDDGRPEGLGENDDDLGEKNDDHGEGSGRNDRGPGTLFVTPAPEG